MRRGSLLILLFLFIATLPKAQKLRADFLYQVLSRKGYAILFKAVSPDTLTVTFEWDFGDGSLGSGPVVNHTFPGKGLYQVSLTVTNGAQSETMQREIRLQAALEIPNVFTPNDDGYNDLFVIGTDGLKRYTLTIYSRSGTIVHRSTSFTPVWDGKTPSGERVHPGVYYYVIRSGNETGEYETSGFVHLIRE